MDISIITRNFNVEKALEEIKSQPDNWLVDTKRQNLFYEQAGTETISLVKPWSSTFLADHRDNHEYRPTDLYKKYPETLKLIYKYFPQELVARIVIVKLLPGKFVFPHVDDGEYYRVRHRYHIAITGSYIYTVEDTRRQIEPGMLFWFNNKRVHTSWNNSTEDRISVIFDVNM
jgi:hypothetical protein